MTRSLYLALCFLVPFGVGCDGCDVAAEAASGANQAVSGGKPFDDVVQLAAGDNETCVVVASGQAFCAGGMQGAYHPELVLARPMTNTEHTAQLSVGQNSCAVQQDGSAVCWGYNINRAMAPPFDSPHEPRPIEGLPPVTHMIANLTGTGFPDWAFARDEPAVWTVGGTSLDPEQVPPRRVEGLALPHVEQVASSNNAYCARYDGGKLQCWDLQGSLDEAMSVSVKMLPAEVPERVVDVAVSYFSLGETQGVCALDPTGLALCWEYVGTDLITARRLEHPLAGGARWKDIAMGVFHSCGVKLEGSVWCAGDNSSGQLGVPKSKDSNRLLRVPGVEGAKAVAVGRRHSCALLRNGGVTCWGDNLGSQCGSGRRGDASPPSPFLRHVDQGPGR